MKPLKVKVSETVNLMVFLPGIQIAGFLFLKIILVVFRVKIQNEYKYIQEIETVNTKIYNDN